MPNPIPIIVHFVGIALFSNQVPNDCGLKVIMPRIAYAAPAKTGTSATHSPSAHIEDHQAVLIFPQGSYDPSSSWGKPTLLPKKSSGTVSYEYVKLDGDRVRFDGGIDNQSVDFERPQLPPLGALCPAMTSLDKRFKPPYSGAAAVFDLPQGAVRGCNAFGRIDTEVNFNGDTGLVISASTMKTRKELRLKPIHGTVELIVANIPVNCLRNGVCSPPNASAINGVSHVHAYYQMASQSASCNKTITDWIAANGAVLKAQCSIVLPPGAGGPINPDVVPTMTDFECSNSRYP